MKNAPTKQELRDALTDIVRALSNGDVVAVSKLTATAATVLAKYI